MSIKIATLVKAHLFRSTNAMLKLAVDDSRKVDWAHSAISQKLKRAEMSKHGIRADKYTYILSHLSYLQNNGNGYAGNYCGGTYNPKEYAPPVTVPVSLRAENAELYAGINDPVYIENHFKMLINHCNVILKNGISDQNAQPHMRSITTALAAMGKMNNTELQQFGQDVLERTVDGKKFQSYGDTKPTADANETKSLIEEIRNWATNFLNDHQKTVSW